MDLLKESTTSFVNLHKKDIVWEKKNPISISKPTLISKSVYTRQLTYIWFWACSKSHLLITATFDVKALQGPPPYEQKRNSLA